MPPAAPATPARKIVAGFPSFRDFVDAALFHPDWGYYATGRVRFGDGGHYETYPDALSPLFGEMIAAHGLRTWRRLGEPTSFEIAEIGAGNGQLCLDVIVTIVRRAARAQDWARFADAFRYRIFERSPALTERQRAKLRGASERVTWTAIDLSRHRPRRLPLGPAGLIVANEVVDCLAHHKVVASPGESPNVVFVIPTVPRGVRARTVALSGVEGQALTPEALDEFMAQPELADVVRFEERQVPVAAIPRLAEHLRRYCPELFADEFVFPPYFACPEIESLMENTGKLYDRAEALWIDYGALRTFHLSEPESEKVFAGPPRSQRSPYDTPGWDDITFLVDFTTLNEAARVAGWTVESLGPQADLARRSGVRLDAAAVDRVVEQRGLRWLMALTGVDPEETWRRATVTWSRRPKRESVRADVERALAEFRGERPSNFRLMALRR